MPWEFHSAINTGAGAPWLAAKAVAAALRRLFADCEYRVVVVCI